MSYLKEVSQSTYSRIQQVFALDAIMLLSHKITCVVTLATSSLCLYFTLSLLISL